MKVAFIQCPAWTTDNPPYAIALIGAALKNAGHEVKCFDLNVKYYNLAKDSGKKHENINQHSWSYQRIEMDWENVENTGQFLSAYRDEIEADIQEIIHYNPSVICFSVHKTSDIISYELTKKIKNTLPGKLIVWGGPNCFRNFKAEAISNRKEIDIICFGDGEITLPVLLTQIEKHDTEYLNTGGYAFRTKDRGLINNIHVINQVSLDDIPFADYSLFDKTKYSWIFFPVIISRGCVNRCVFCVEHINWDKYQFRSPEKVVDEIEYQKSKHPYAQNFWLTCSMINGNIRQFEKFCELLIERKLDIHWQTQLTVSKQISFELLQKMKLSGCNSLNYGLENASDYVLKQMKKNFDIRTARNVFKLTAKAGIPFNLNFIVGFPGETVIRFAENLLFIRQHLIYGITPVVATCNLIQNSFMYDNYRQYKIQDPKTMYWKTLGSGNTYRNRLLRQYFTKQLVDSHLLNVLPAFYQKHGFYTPLPKFLLAKYHLSYIIFLFWLVYVMAVIAGFEFFEFIYNEAIISFYTKIVSMFNRSKLIIYKWIIDLKYKLRLFCSKIVDLPGKSMHYLQYVFSFYKGAKKDYRRRFSQKDIRSIVYKSEYEYLFRKKFNKSVRKKIYRMPGCENFESLDGKFNRVVDLSVPSEKRTAFFKMLYYIDINAVVNDILTMDDKEIEERIKSILNKINS